MPDIIVHNQTELDAALKNATGGETIKLAAGQYTSITLNNKKYTSNVTIESLDPDSQVVLQSIDLKKVANLTVKNLQFKQEWASDGTMNSVLDSNNITFSGVTISGGTEKPTESVGLGLAVRGGTNFTFENSSIDHFAVGMGGRNVDGMVVKDSTFHDNRRDHTNFSEMTNMVIDNNMFTNLFPINGEHSDAIQFMTAGRTKGNTNITITNNVVMQGDGYASQGIFMAEEDGNLPYENVTIKNNFLYESGYYHGINIVHGNNVTVDSNTTLSQMDGMSYWIRLDNISNAKVTNNVTDQLVITSSSTNVTTANNVSLNTDSVAVRKLWDLNAVDDARLSNLLIDGAGYHPQAGSIATSLIASEPAMLVKSSVKSLLLDLNFTATGLVDTGHWSSDETVKAISLSNISNGMYHVQTGAGFELDRSYSRQIFSLPAFTINFDLKRDSSTATTGGILSIYKSWSISLTAKGEITFNVINDAGKSFSVTTSGAKITDAANHKIAVTYDSLRGKAFVYVDGVAKGSMTVSGSTRPAEYWGLYVGNQFGTAFSGSIGNIEMREGALSASELVAMNASSVASSSTSTQYTMTKGAASVATSLVAGVESVSSATLASTSLTSGVTAQSALVQKIAATDSVTTAGALSSALPVSTSLLTAKLATFDLYHV